MKLKYEAKNAWEFERENNRLDDVMDYSKGYMQFLNVGKTERTSAREIVRMAKENGYISIDEAINNGKISPGDKIYAVNKDKAVALFIIGKNKLENGMKIIGGHIDSPRIDLKPHPLYQESNLGFFKTHYYGGIKKYQWTAIPLAIHGVLVKANGEKQIVNIGEDELDPIFTITDLLPHLAVDQMDKKLKEAITGENLELIVGNIPVKDQKDISEKVKFNIMKLLNEKYGIVEKDFISSELEVVPAFNAKSLGFDKSMVAGYGQDDKVCAYTSLRAILDVENPEKTCVCLFSDKEEIGSIGNTGMESNVFDTFIGQLLSKCGVNRFNALNEVFCKSRMLSADVDAGLDPLYASVSDKPNAGLLGHGMALVKYTGARGKSGASDANAEFMAEIRNVFENNNIEYQSTELGKVDIGGGGTIAYILANKGCDVVDCGVPVLSMHAPYEVTSKFDIYCAYRAYKAFFVC